MQENSLPFQISDQSINFACIPPPHTSISQENTQLLRLKPEQLHNQSNLLNTTSQLNSMSMISDAVAFNHSAVGNIIANFASGLNLPKMANSKKITRHKFTPEEDEILKNLVSTYGPNDWQSISSHFVGRNARQCRERWKHYISPDVVTGPWTEEENQLLLKKHEEHGSQWAIIALSFPGRTDIGVKNHYISITTRKNKELLYQSSKNLDELSTTDVNTAVIDNSNNDSNIANTLLAQDMFNAMQAQIGQMNIPPDQIQMALQQMLKQQEEKTTEDSTHDDQIL